VQSYDAGSTGSDVVTVEAYAVPMVAGTAKSLTASGPGHTTSGANFKVRLGWDDPSLLNGQSRIGYLLLQATAGYTAAEVPVRLTRTAAGVAPFALAPGVARSVTLPVGGAQDTLYFDVPPGATSVTFATAGSTGNVDLYLARVASPSSPSIDPAPARSAAQASATSSSGNESITLTPPTLQAGRWYVTPVNPTGGTVSATVTVTVNSAAAPPAFKAGHYYDPTRSGHGVFIDFAGPVGNPDQWVMVWYTYLEDGTPTWYYAQGAVPGVAGIWRADLLRVVWNGSATSATDVGEVVITETGTGSATFSFNLDGTSGSEQFARLGGGGCPVYNTQALDVSGHWYSPDKSGFGYSYQAETSQEVFIPYVYDGVGFPRWAYGQKVFNGAVNNFSLTQFTGFCPTCSFVSLVGTAVGSATRTLSGATVSTMSSSVTFAGAVSGSWSENRAVALLSQVKNCQ
jgi:hypothetical protein